MSTFHLPRNKPHIVMRNGRWICYWLTTGHNFTTARDMCLIKAWCGIMPF